MNWTPILTLVTILLYIQVVLTIIGTAFMLAISLFIILPEIGILTYSTMDSDSKQERLKELQEQYRKHPLWICADAICPFAFWWWNAVKFVWRKQQY